MSEVVGNLRVYGIDNLCIADGSIMSRLTPRNTIAGCVIIGERDGEIIREKRKL